MRFPYKLQKWIKDKNITLADLKTRGFTLATEISQIIMVTTPNSLKHLKFVGGLSEKNICKWVENVTDTFGVVKWDKSTRFFHGDMVQSSYQLLNTLGLDKAQAEELLKPSFDYISLVRNDVEFMRYHFTDAYVREKDGEEKKVSDGLADRADVIFRLLFSCTHFNTTALYANFRDKDNKRVKEGTNLLQEIRKWRETSLRAITTYNDGQPLLCGKQP